ncbi:MAG: hypothetical protein VXY16_01770 [Pseudomonadota bacterium]|nr:hypothetical protein [Pseudomonadota bacterium]
MRFYNVNTRGDKVVFCQRGKESFKVRAHQLADFVYLIENVHSGEKVNDDLTTRKFSLDTAFLAPGAAGFVVPTARLTFNELGNFVARRRSVMDELLEGWRIDLFDVDYDALSEASDDFCAIDKYSYTIPMTTADGESVRDKLEDDYLGTVLKFQAAAKGQGDKPQVYRDDLYDDSHVNIAAALVSKEAVDHIEDRGTHRVLHFKSEYHHLGRAGNVVDVTVNTPMSADELKQALGREHLRVVTPSSNDLGGSAPKPL